MLPQFGVYVGRGVPLLIGNTGGDSGLWQLGLANSTWSQAACLVPHYSGFLLGNSVDEQDLPNWPWTSLPNPGLMLLQPPLLQQARPISKHNSAILHLTSKSSCSEQIPVGQTLFRVACPAFFPLPELYIPRLVAGRISGKVNCLGLHILGAGCTCLLSLLPMELWVGESSVLTWHQHFKAVSPLCLLCPLSLGSKKSPV